MKQFTRFHNEVRYDIIESNINVDSIAAIDDKKLILNGKLSFEIITNSYKYGKQAQIIVYGADIKLQKRISGKYNRFEIDIPFNIFKEIIKKMNIS